MEPGILTQEQEKKLAELLDDAIKFKGVLEIVDGYVFKALLTLLDDRLVNALPEPIKIKLAEIADAVIADDIEKAEQLSTELINALVDVPLLDEIQEGLIIGALIRLIVSAVINWIEKKKDVAVHLELKR